MRATRDRPVELGEDDVVVGAQRGERLRRAGRRALDELGALERQRVDELDAGVLAQLARSALSRPGSRWTMMSPSAAWAAAGTTSSERSGHGEQGRAHPIARIGSSAQILERARVTVAGIEIYSWVTCSHGHHRDPADAARRPLSGDPRPGPLVAVAARQRAGRRPADGGAPRARAGVGARAVLRGRHRDRATPSSTAGRARRARA